MPTNPFFQPTGSANLGNTIGTGVTWTPQQLSDWYMQFAATPAGQAAQRARDQTAELNRKQVLDQLQNERDRIALQSGRDEADAWYQRKQIELMRDDHAITRERLAFDRERMGLDEAFRRDELGINTQFRAAELGSQLRGPRNYPFYLEAANQIAGSPVANLVDNRPGLGGMPANYAPQRQTLASVLGDFGFGGGQGGAPPVSNAQLGLTDRDASTLVGYLRNPHTAPGGWLESKTQPQRESIAGLAEYWGFDPQQVEEQYRNTRTRQGSPFLGTAG